VTERFPAANPAFDVTPAELVHAIVTERGVHSPPFEETLPYRLEVAR
jgi:methylthioribose-1-phosphate isomerase